MELRVSEFTSKKNGKVLFIKLGTRYTTIKGLSKEEKNEEIESMVKEYSDKLSDDKLLSLIRAKLVTNEDTFTKIKASIFDEGEYTYYNRHYYDKGENVLTFTKTYIAKFILSLANTYSKLKDKYKVTYSKSTVKVKLSIDNGELIVDDFYPQNKKSYRKPRTWDLFDFNVKDLESILENSDKDKEDFIDSIIDKFNLEDISIKINNVNGQKTVITD